MMTNEPISGVVPSDAIAKTKAVLEGPTKSGTRAKPAASKNETSQSGSGRKNLRPLILIVVALILGCLAVFQYLRNRPEGRPGWLRISGRIEGYEVNVGAKIAGRVEFISNREGEEVRLGQPLVKLSDEDIQAQLRGAKARYQEALEAVEEAEEQLKVSKEQVAQAKLNVSASLEDAKGRVDQAAANLASQKALLSQAIANEVQSKADLELAALRQKRYDNLVLQHVVTQDADDQARTTYESAIATVEARRAAVVSAERQVTSAESALLQAKSNLYNPPIRISQQAANTRTVAQNEAAVLRAKHDVKNAKAAIDEIAANIVYLNINSPIRGVVTARTVEPGAVVAAGQTVISLINLDTVFLRAYVPDSEIGKVRINQRALIYYDSDPHHGVSGKVIEIDPKASFTPENIYFRDDRVKQVFGIKIMIDNPANYAKPGMPADADIDISPNSGAEHS
jgi:HlyD family secretion protein